VANDYAERRAAREATEGLPERYRRLVAQQDQTVYIHLTQARVVAAGVSPLPAACCRDALARTAVRDCQVVVRPSASVL
jgi:hypothetical protein